MDLLNCINILIRENNPMSDRKEYKHNWYLKNREKVLQDHKQYQQEHKEEINEKNKRYYWKHREQALNYWKSYAANNKEKIREKNRKYREEHKEELTAKRRDRTRIKYGLKPFHYKNYLKEHNLLGVNK